MDMKDYDIASYTRAEDAAADAMAAYMMAKAATEVEAAETAQAEAEAALGKTQEFLGMVMAARQTVMDEMDAAAAKAARSKMAMTKETAIKEEDGATPNTGGFDDDVPYKLEISHEDGAVSVKVTDLDMPLKNDPQFMEDDGKYVRDNGNGVTEIVGVHTDIEAPKTTPFARRYGAECKRRRPGTDWRPIHQLYRPACGGWKDSGTRLP